MSKGDNNITHPADLVSARVEGSNTGKARNKYPGWRSAHGRSLSGPRVVADLVSVAASGWILHLNRGHATLGEWRRSRLDVHMSDRPVSLGRPTTGDLFALAVAVTAFSTVAPIIAASTVPALAISFYRCLLGSSFTAPWAWFRHRAEWKGLTRSNVRGASIAGALLALHFATWITSLRLTSVASSAALLALQPIWAAFFARWSGVQIGRQVWVGIGLSLVGVLMLTGVDVSTDPTSLLGDLLALIGGVLSAAYMTSGERVRQSVANPVYTTIAYGSAAAVLLILCGIFRTPMSGFGVNGWLAILAVTLGGQLLGHSLVNRALKRTSATVGSLAILLEMPGAVIIAAVWLGQVPPASIIPALLLLLVGLVLVIRGSDAPTLTELPSV